MDQLNNYLFIAAALFSIGLFGVMTRRNGIAVLMGVELILNAANINFVAFSRFGGMNIDGHIFALIVIVLAAAEAAVALAIVINIYNNLNTINIDEASMSEVRDLKLIAKNYLSRWFFIDFWFISVPFFPKEITQS